MEILRDLFSEFHPYLMVLVVIGIVLTIMLNILRPSNAFLVGTLSLVLIGVLEVQDFLISFSNQQIITIFALIFITAAIRRNINVDLLFDKWFPPGVHEKSFLARMTLSTAFFSSFLNNTPIVAMVLSNVQQWARKSGKSPSKYLIPLSYAAMLGGMITIIGTSTNLVLQGLLSSNQEELLGSMDFLVVGSIVCFAGLIYLIFVSPKLLPERTIAIDQYVKNKGEYIHEVELAKDSSLVGKSVQDAGLKNLKGIYLVEILRGEDAITPIAPEVVIEKNDHLYFAGDSGVLIDFIKGEKGLILSSSEKLQKQGSGDVVEAIIPANSKLSGLLVKDSDFRETYNASILGIHRNGEKVSGKIGELALRTGDLLLLLTGEDFENRLVHDKNLHLLTAVRKSWQKPKTKMPKVYLGAQLIVALALVGGQISFFISLLLSLFLLVLFRFLNIDVIKRNFNFDLLIVLACSISLGKAFISTGAADMISQGFFSTIHTENTALVLFSLFAFTALLTTMITNVAAVSIAFPVAYALAHQLNMPGAPFYLTIAFAASAAFLTPMGYQTNMMVYGPGSYKSSDFLRAGLPLMIIYSLVSLLTIFWWFDI